MLWYFLTEKLLNYDLINMVDAAIKYDTYSYDLNRITKFISSNLIYDRNYIPIKRIKKTIKIKQKIEDVEKLDESSDKYDEKLFYDLSAYENLKHKVSTTILTFTYIGIKILYLLVSVVQVFLMDYFLSSKRHNFYGREVLEKIV
jgi:hypothetical protein